jgi:hypothetical protein
LVNKQSKEETKSERTGKEMTRRLLLIFGMLIVITITAHFANKHLAEQKAQAQVNIDQALDAEYVKGFEAALDCRGLMSAPLCEELLKRAGR